MAPLRPGALALLLDAPLLAPPFIALIAVRHRASAGAAGACQEAGIAAVREGAERGSRTPVGRGSHLQTLQGL